MKIECNALASIRANENRAYVEEVKKILPDCIGKKECKFEAS
jgi:hypothetical protein